MDIIFVRELRVETFIGVYEWEKRIPQTIQLDMEIALPDTAACQSDDIRDTLDYADVVRHIQGSLSEQRCNLLEALAEHVAQILIARFNVPWVKISVAKLSAIRDNRMVGVSIERGRIK